MTSEVQICNMALLSLHEKTITSLTEERNNRALACNQFYAPVRDAVLETFPWDFAKRRSGNLAQDATAPSFGFSYRYALPNSPKCLRVLEINGSDSIEWEVENGFLLTDEESVQIRYIAQVTDPQKFSPTFVMLLAARLAAEIAYTVTENRAKEEQAWALYEKKEFDAFDTQSQTGSHHETDENDYLIDARH